MAISNSRGGFDDEGKWNPGAERSSPRGPRAPSGRAGEPGGPGRRGGGEPASGAGVCATPPPPALRVALRLGVHWLLGCEKALDK